MRTHRTLAALACAALLGTACGGGETSPPASTPGAGGEVTASSSSLGEILVDGDGMTLYAFTDDVDGESTCYDACATTWPPVPGDTVVGSGLDQSAFTSIDRDDGSTQLAVAGNPLYTFTGDAEPGDVTGQGSGDVWFVVAPDGTVVTDAEAADDPTDDPIDDSTTSPPGDAAVLTDGDGFSLYVFTNDEAGVSTCNDPCSSTWPPVPADAEVGIDTLRLSVVERDDGSEQIALDDLPLYRYAGDANPGDVNGQGVGGVWFAVGADGEVLRPDGIRTGSTDDGEVLIGADSFTLYVFANDEPGVSTCNDPCSSTWPPVPGDEFIDASALDPDQFGVITRDDGSQQLAVDDQPLYRYSGDEFPGDANGITVGDGVWTTLSADDLHASDDPNAGPVQLGDAGGGAEAENAEDDDDGYGGPGDGSDPAAGGIRAGETDLGPTLVDADGFTLYALTEDSDGVSTCNDACADAWPPVPGDTPAGDGVDADQVSTIQRDDGSTQLQLGDWPLYRFSGDGAPGDTNGQGSGGVWFAVAPDGSLIQE